jgi:hypothetical protein
MAADAPVPIAEFAAAGALPFPLPSQPLDLETTRGAAPAGVQAPIEPLETIPYSDRIRGRIAERLIWMLAGVILLAFATFWRATPAAAPGELQDFLAILFGPLVALVSAAVGYYFGGKAG